MKTEHVNDQDIQDYAVDFENTAPNIIEHINSCDRCEAVAQSYKSLSKEIKRQPKPIFDPILADLVMGEIPKDRHRKKKNHAQIGILTLICLGVLAIVIDVFQSNPINLFEISNPGTSFSICVSVFITLLWGWDMVKSFHKKMTQINLS